MCEKFKYFFAQKLINWLNEYNKWLCLKNTTTSKDSFLEGAKVFNFQNDKIKIIIGENSKIWSGDSIIIGNHVSISHNCNIHDTNSHELDFIERKNSHLYRMKNNLTTNKKGNIITAPIIIEDHVWISFNVIVLKGVRLGKGINNCCRIGSY